MYIKNKKNENPSRRACMHVHMGLPMLIKQRLTPACMHAYADVISLGGDLRYPKQCNLCWNVNCTDLPSVLKFPFSLHEMVAGNGSTSIPTLHSMQLLICQVMHLTNSLCGPATAVTTKLDIVHGTASMRSIRVAASCYSINF